MARGPRRGARAGRAARPRRSACSPGATARSCSRRRRPGRRGRGRASRPGTPDLGVMLPYSPLHHLLLADAGAPLVMTSGQRLRRADRLPTTRTRASASRASPTRFLRPRPPDRDPRRRLGRARAGRGAARAAPLARLRARRASRCRGAAPPLLACGAELKSTFCLAKGGRAWVGPPHRRPRELRDAALLPRGRSRTSSGCSPSRPSVVAHDLHPDYLSTRLRARARRRRAVAVQHHHAHLAACLAEHGETGAAVGAIYDGAGSAPTATSGAASCSSAASRGFERAGHLWPVRLPGRRRRRPRAVADGVRVAARARRRTIRSSRRCSPERVAAALGGGRRARAKRRRGAVDDQCRAAVRRRRRALRHPLHDQLRGPGADRARGGLRPATSAARTRCRSSTARPVVLDARATIAAILEDLARGAATGVIAARFHGGLAAATARACALAARRSGLETVVLSGGAFQNRVLLERTSAQLARGRPAGADPAPAAAERRRHRVRAGGGRCRGGCG